MKYQLHCSAVKLARKDGLFGKSDPFVIIKSYGKPVGFSNVVMKNLNPFWDPIELDVDACGGPHESITIEVFDFDSDAKHDFIGSFTVPIQEFIRNLNKKYPLMNSSLKKQKPQGHFVLTRADVDNRPNALAYSVHFVGKSLARKDGLLGKSDPFLMIYTNGNIQGQSSDKLIFVAKTEWIKDSLNPVWDPLTLSVHSCGGLDMELLIRAYDYDSDGGHDLIGACTTTLRQLVTSKPTLLLIDQKKVGKLYNNSGTLSVGTAPPTQPLYDDNIGRINIQFRAKKLDNKDTFSKSDPYLKIMKGDSFTLHTTPHIKNDLNPVWPAFDLLVSECGLTEVLTFEVWDHDSGSDDFIGSCAMSLRHLLFWEKNPAWRLKNPKRRGLTQNSGMLEVVSLNPYASGPSAGAMAGPAMAGVPYASQYGTSHPPAYGTAQPQPGAYGTAARNANEFPSHINANIPQQGTAAPAINASPLMPQQQPHNVPYQSQYTTNAMTSQYSPQGSSREGMQAAGAGTQVGDISLQKQPEPYGISLNKKPEASSLPSYATNY
eukprot:CAMPEP_0206187122 /NCGR_PEP_ID=MMETSP0166-20121206/2813_1 /ASSEMBLY_ACC=CAM_ASM_000260 /TAXON_ID=95228 /ORGANISM="Vannella robusta, Strain DIVA3 518/3/11/1/6" /LENGTH=545 /DNA_ID=CAMNT_0053602643 /DNA_START=11 /DNA_END=1649 /DNA_ORIENTATION=+